MKTPKIKICGLRSAEHAVAAARAGADFLGFVFVEGVRRQIWPEDGRKILAEYRRIWASNSPMIVGLFRNQSQLFVNKTIASVGLDLVQLCGEEPTGFAAGIDVPTIRQIRVHQHTSGNKLRTLVENALDHHRMVILDHYDPDTPGGSGLSFDWHIAIGIANLPNVVLAGGLKPDNVDLAIKAVNPWALDVSSGVETNGTKDTNKIHAFVRVSRSYQSNHH